MTELVYDDPPVYHAVARCRWCQGRFLRVYGVQWACETPTCAEKQIAFAMLKTNPPDDPNVTPYLFLPLPMQVDMEQAKVTNLLVAGAAGTAKSHGARWHLYRKARRIQGFRALLLRCTYDQLLKNHLQFMAQEGAALGDAKYTGGNVRQMQFDNGSVLFMGYCDDESDISQHVGPEWDEIVFEEGVTFLPKALNEITARARGSSTAREAMARLGEKPCTRILSNPGGRAMLYLHDLYITRTPDREEYPTYRAERFGHMGSTLDDNPYLSEEYEAENLSHLSAARYKQLRHGDWSVFAGQFFGAFDPAQHMRSMAVA